MTIANRAEFSQQLAAGKGWFFPFLATTSTTPTTAIAGTGFHTITLFFNSIGSSLPGTIVGFKMPTAPPQKLLNALSLWTINSNSQRGISFGWFYKLGTLNLAATGDQFTHDSATFPMLRTVYGQASQPISLVPIIYITTATTTTAAVFTLKTAADGTGYVDQDGNNTVGSKTMTLPSATTGVQSGYIFRLEEGDSAIRDISAIQVNTSAAVGAADIYGFEPLISLPSLLAQQTNAHDGLVGIFSPGDLNPAVPTSGTSTAYFGMLVTSALSSVAQGFFSGALAA